ncbi:MAG: hypothetical protein QOE95_2349, partial [Gaiellaceae bacterium]|nr:hypothetical protein [Gaiellaceae bacterium]
MKARILVRGALVLGMAGAILVGIGASRPERAGAYDPSRLATIQQRILSGFASTELGAAVRPNPQRPANYFPRGSDSCPSNLSSNIKVNQNCLNLSDADLQGRGQAQNETAIAQDPYRPNHIVATSNDYRHGDTNCGDEYSLDKGRTWNDAIVPMSFTRGGAFGVEREYWQVGGDPSVAWDSKGNAFLACQQIQRGGFGFTSSNDASSSVYVYRSSLNYGASWNFPGRPAVESADTGGSFTAPFEDKPYMTVDNHLGSPFQDRIYVTYTEFSFVDGSAYIWESYSADHGEHFSPRHLVSVTSPHCTRTYGLGTPQGSCNENQYSQPFTSPDGTLYVVYANFNGDLHGAGDNRSQILIVKSTDGGETFGAPVKVADFYDLPVCATYQDGKDFGTACVPEKGPTSNSFWRAANYPSGAVDPTNPQRVVVTFGSYVNVHSNEANGCTPAGNNPATGQALYTGVKTPGACNNDILESVSTDAGATFTGTATDPRALTSATQDPAQAATDQWFQWIAFTKSGKLATSYYDRQYGDDETTGFSDVSLSGTGDFLRFNSYRATSSPMPPPTQFEGSFLGDYTGLTAVDNAYPLWTDTRNPALFVCPNQSDIAVCGATNADGV